MAAETVANLLDLLKEVWTQNKLEEQFYNQNRFLDKVEKTNKYTIGRQAQVPVHLSLPGGATTHTAAGGTLNAADDLRVDRADYTLAYQWQQIEIEVGALSQADGPVHSTVDAADETVKANVSAMRRELGRQFIGNQDALIAECGTTTASTTVNLSTTGYGFDAIERGWLRPGVLIDIGTAANEVSVASDRTITSVSENSADPEIVISGAAVTTAAGDYVSVANARTGTTSRETNGLRQIVGSSTTTVGTIAPASVPEWKPAYVDSTTTTVSLDLLLTLQRKVFQKSGAFPSYVTTSPKVQADLYALFQSQVRFDKDSQTGAGNAHSFTWNGVTVEVDPDIPNRELYMLTLDDFLVITGGAYGKPTWVSDLSGTKTGMTWKQGNTSVVDALFYPIQLGIKRRNRSAAAIALTA